MYFLSVAFLLGHFCFAVKISDFQPSVIPVRSSTRLTIVTADQLNASSAVWCRLGDMSVPAEVKGGLVFCDMPPMRDTDKAALHLDVDGKLFKAKKPLRLHKPFKVTDISPKTASPAQQLKIKMSGIKCEKWMQFFVRFQSANATKATQKGVCNNATVTCYVPEFPAHTLLRVGVTLSNRIVEWSPTKLLVQYPVDAIKSSLNELDADTSKRGAFGFKVVLKDKFHNQVHLTDEFKTSSAISVQYAPFEKAKSFKFIECDVSTVREHAGSVYSVSCGGADHEHILVYPSINNVPVGGRDSYEVKTTLCPGKSSCDDHTTTIIIVCCVIGSIVILVSAVIIYRRRRYTKKVTLAQLQNEQHEEIPLDQHRTTEELQLPRDVDILTTSSTGSVEDLPMSSRNDGFCTPDEEILRMQKLSEEEGYGQLGVSRDELAAKDASKNSETELGSAVVDILKKAKTGPRESEVETEGCEMSFTEGKHRMVVDVKIEGLSRSDEDMEAKSEEIA